MIVLLQLHWGKRNIKRRLKKNPDHNVNGTKNVNCKLMYNLNIVKYLLKCMYLHVGRYRIKEIQLKLY